MADLTAIRKNPGVGMTHAVKFAICGHKPASKVGGTFKHINGSTLWLLCPACAAAKKADE